MEGTAEFKIGNATVRIHPGKLSNEERKELWERETTKYLKAVLKARKKQNQKSAEA